MNDDEKATQANDESAIRALIDDFVAAMRAKDVAAVMSVFSADAVSFDLGPPLRHGGGEPFERRWRELFDAYEGAIDYELQELSIVANGDVAFSHSLNRVAGTTKAGKRSERWLRWTACFRKAGRGWRIVHEHVSVPVDLRSGKAVLDLTPERT